MYKETLKTLNIGKALQVPDFIRLRYLVLLGHRPAAKDQIDLMLVFCESDADLVVINRRWAFKARNGTFNGHILATAH
jgi:hypothetical protein